MVKTELVEHLISDGERLLRELDRQQFPVESMFWIDLPEQGYWRLIIGSPVVTEQGSAAAYRRLDAILRELGLTGIALEDLSVLDPDSQQFQSLRSAAASSSEDAFAYRWNSASIKGVMTCQVTLDDLNRFWNTERKLSNLPAILIDLEGRQVTLRFHPQHYILEGLENIKSSFQIALHRPDARPDCDIRWLN